MLVAGQGGPAVRFPGRLPLTQYVRTAWAAGTDLTEGGIMKTTGQNTAAAVGREPAGGADRGPNIHAEKRACRRIHANLQARLFYGNLIYTGTVTNLSEKGMFIRTKVQFPVNSVCITLVLVNEQVVKIPVKVKRTAAPESEYSTDCGIGVELVNAPQNYLDYVSASQASA